MITCIYDYISMNKCIKCIILMHEIVCYHLPCRVIRALSHSACILASNGRTTRLQLCFPTTWFPSHIAYAKPAATLHSPCIPPACASSLPMCLLLACISCKPLDRAHIGCNSCRGLSLCSSCSSAPGYSKSTSLG